jgi:hypothetical protein
MSKQRKVFQFRMEPTALQAEELLRMAGTAPFIWNWALDRLKPESPAFRRGEVQHTPAVV